MLTWIIHRCIANRVLVLLGTVLLVAMGLLAMQEMAIDALPDLSDTQVIVHAQYPGQPPGVVQDQVAYPLSEAMLSVPYAKTVRTYSLYNDAYTYVLFNDGTDLYWARSRVLEYLTQLQGRLPAGVTLSLGPDATGVGWVYEYALVDRTHQHDLAQLRSIQDWFLRYQLKSVPDVAEVASIGGMVREYQVVVDPLQLVSYQITVPEVVAALRNANNEVGGAVVELAETDYMVRAHGYLHTIDDFRAIPLKTTANGTVVRIGDVAQVVVGPQLRVGVADLDGAGEVAGGVVLLRSGANAMNTIKAVKQRLAELQKSLPAGVEIVTTYDRSDLIQSAIENLRHKLIEEFAVVALVTVLFLGHLRSSLVAILALPTGIFAAFIVMNHQHINANIMSLGGIAIAIGAMIDAAIVMVENAHKHLELWKQEHPDREITTEERWQLMGDAASEVGPALFFSLLIITCSFLPVFSLQGQEGRLFAPLAFTKTLVMAASALLSISMVPVLMGYWIRGNIAPEQSNPLNRILIRLYEPVLNWVLRHPWITIMAAVLIAVSGIWPVLHTGSEFLPPLNEGTLLYMPSAVPGMPAEQAARLLKISDRIIHSLPEVEHVFGKAGRADTATDPAPMEMFESIITFKPQAHWRPGMTADKLRDELDQKVHIPGLTNLWVPPIRNRIDMLSTGIKSPIGIKVYGADLEVIDRISQQIAHVAATVTGVSSAFAERLNGGHYIDIDINRMEAGRYGMNISDVQTIIDQAIGGQQVSETVEGVERYPIIVRYPRTVRDTPAKLANLVFLSPRGEELSLGMIAKIHPVDGPPMIRSENALTTNWVYIDIAHRDLGSVVHDLQSAIAQQIVVPAGVRIAYAGQFENMQHATARLKIVTPITIIIILLLLYLTFRQLDEALMILLSLPLALSGGLWLVHWLGYNYSVAVGVGFIALAGVAAEFGVVMFIYLRQAVQRHSVDNQPLSAQQLIIAIHEGAVQRVRPKAMTVAVICAGLAPVMFGSGTGSEIMRRIAAPMVGGMLTAPLLSMLLLPVLYWLKCTRRNKIKNFPE